jgi:hypothetical protein
MENREHPMVAYMQMLACLMKAYELEIQGLKREALALTKVGYEAINSIKDPTGQRHYMELQYHVMNAEEFLDMRRLSALHPRAAHRLEHLADRAKLLKSDGLGKAPAMSFGFAPVVGWGARSASVAGLLISLASLLHWPQPVIHEAINSLWVYSAEQVPQFAGHAKELLSSAAANMPDLLAHTGGLSSPLASATVHPVLLAHNGGLGHTGGIAAQLAALASHTGGFA